MSPDESDNSAGSCRQGSRLSQSEIRFSFDGDIYPAQRGDTAASALLRAGVRLFGRSIKYRRPRGVFTAGIEEPNALFTVGPAPDFIPNVPATTLVLKDGIKLSSQNRWPSLRHDAAAALQLGGRLFGAGFYYKTFMWPSWRTYEHMIRRLAGMGAAPRRSSTGVPRVEHVNCDVLVIGGGPAGIAAAAAAAHHGARVMLCEREPALGGELDFEGATIDGLTGTKWVRNMLAGPLSAVDVRTDTPVVADTGGVVVAHRYPGGLSEDHEVCRIRAQHIVTATGAIEHGIAFVNNDRPGVMLLGAAERYFARYGVSVGRRLVIFGNHERIYSAACRFSEAGLTVVAVIDTRDVSAIRTDRSLLIEAGIPCLSCHAIARAVGKLQVTGAELQSLDGQRTSKTVQCDAILVSGGWSASRLSRLETDIASNEPLRVTCDTGAKGFPLRDVLIQGHSAGTRAALRVLPHANGTFELKAPEGAGDPPSNRIEYYRVPCRPGDEKYQFVDLQNDVTVADLRQALSEGFTDIEHVKRYTTLGVGTDQGATCAALGASILAELASTPGSPIRTSRQRPPYQPLTLATLSGFRRDHALRPERRTAIHAWHIANGAVMEDMALWMRPRYYRANGSDPFAAGTKEALRVRTFGGVFDASTLGKIEIAGKDASAYLDRLYLNRMSTLAMGHAKYGVLLREDGMVLDDGIVFRATEDRYTATSSSGHAAPVLAHFEFWRDREFSRRDVAIADVTEAWSTIVIAGPSCRRHLREALGEAWSACIEKLGHMRVTTGIWNAAALRVLRASFSGELAFELHCQPTVALELWQRLVATGLSPYGMEAADILRQEKGYLVSSEINGQTSPHDLQMNALLTSNNPCIGRELLNRPGLHESARRRLVGIKSDRKGQRFLGGAQLVEEAGAAVPCGYVTSSAYSPTLEEWIGLALVARRIPEGAHLLAKDPLRGLATPVRLTGVVHFDTAAERMKS